MLGSELLLRKIGH